MCNRAASILRCCFVLSVRLSHKAMFVETIHIGHFEIRRMESLQAIWKRRFCSNIRFVSLLLLSSCFTSLSLLSHACSSLCYTRPWLLTLLSCPKIHLAMPAALETFQPSLPPVAPVSSWIAISPCNLKESLLTKPKEQEAKKASSEWDQPENCGRNINAFPHPPLS